MSNQMISARREATAAARQLFRLALHHDLLPSGNAKRIAVQGDDTDDNEDK